MALQSEEIKDPIDPQEAPPSYSGEPLDKETKIGEFGVSSGRLIKENNKIINIADIWNNIYSTVQKALRVIPLERNEVRWTTQADFNKGTHDKTQVIPEGDGAVSLTGSPNGDHAVYHLNEASGDQALDSSGNARHGTLINMEDADWQAGKLNNCLEFGGVNEYVMCLLLFLLPPILIYNTLAQ